MSLINEALKRAKEAQEQTPPSASPGPQFRPADPAQDAGRNPGLMAPVTFGVVALVALVLLWQWMHKGGTTPSKESQNQLIVAARPADPAPAVEPAPIAATPPEAGSGTNPPAISEAPPKPAPLRLQAIVFNPTRPSAMIGGKTLFIGDKLGEFRVMAINQQSATLAGGGQTNILSLPE